MDFSILRNQKLNQQERTTEYIKTEVHLANKTNMDFVELKEQQCARWDFDEIQAGFFCINVNVLKTARIVLAFSEQKSNNGQLDMKQLNSHNVIEWNLPKGNPYALEL